jgi:hypothetical protein
MVLPFGALLAAQNQSEAPLRVTFVRYGNGLLFLPRRPYSSVNSSSSTSLTQHHHEQVDDNGRRFVFDPALQVVSLTVSNATVVNLTVPVTFSIPAIQDEGARADVRWHCAFWDETGETEKTDFVQRKSHTLFIQSSIFPL